MEQQTPEQELTIESPRQFKALSHPLRQRLLLALGGQPATAAELAAALDSRKSTVAHHLKVLQEAGVVRIVETRKVRGGSEHLYRRTARRITVAGRDAGPTTALLGAVAEECAKAPREPLLSLRHLRLTAAQAARLAATLQALVDEAVEAPDGEPVHGVLVALYEQGAGRD
ncbi:helix-turn-helix domain-containing protein [Kitasatospora sp. NPDC057965]|uniref:helix-turn-helix domain-containing protein n=1 Tax=Kitasatospora sp. NPDC057965 TaxID=3346291 RepID=UPI0036DCFCA1